MRRRILLTATILLALAFAACEKSNEAVLEEQYEEAAGTCPTGCVDAPPDCLIKGNIGGTGQKFYILPGDAEYYPYAFVEPEKGERWFCTEREAMGNGFNPVPRPAP